jgi:hypothetical protein
MTKLSTIAAPFAVSEGESLRRGQVWAVYGPLRDLVLLMKKLADKPDYDAA